MAASLGRPWSICSNVLLRDFMNELKAGYVIVCRKFPDCSIYKMTEFGVTVCRAREGSK